MNKQSLFISYCWKDGNSYADELETQLKDKFDVRRDKSQLIANDDILDFMAGIANCDNVIIVLTAEYVKSLNCMLEMAILVEQEDWKCKTMVLVIDDSLYSMERKIEVVNYWFLWKQRNASCASGVVKELYKEENEYLEMICGKVEPFFVEVSRRKNPSQIAIVNEVIKKSMRNTRFEIEFISKNEEKVMNFIEKNETTTLSEISAETGLNNATVRRLVVDLIAKCLVEAVGNGKGKRYCKKTPA